MDMYGMAFAVRESCAVGGATWGSESADCSASLRPSELAKARSEEPTPAAVRDESSVYTMKTMDLHLEFAVPNSPALLPFAVGREFRVFREEDVSGTS